MCSVHYSRPFVTSKRNFHRAFSVFMVLSSTFWKRMITIHEGLSITRQNTFIGASLKSQEGQCNNANGVAGGPPVQWAYFSRPVYAALIRQKWKCSDAHSARGVIWGTSSH